MHAMKLPRSIVAGKSFTHEQIESGHHLNSINFSLRWPQVSPEGIFAGKAFSNSFNKENFLFFLKKEYVEEPKAARRQLSP